MSKNSKPNGLAYTQEWTCTCNGCGKQYTYGDENSPVVYPKVWRSILTYWGVTEEEERKIYSEYIQIFKKWEFSEGEEKQRLFDEMRKPKYHLFFCTECMEKALGRKLERADVDFHLPYNQTFFEKYEEKAK